MDERDPPSFETFFNADVGAGASASRQYSGGAGDPQRQSSSSSSNNNFFSYTPDGFAQSLGGLGGLGGELMDEPSALRRRGSQASLGERDRDGRRYSSGSQGRSRQGSGGEGSGSGGLLGGGGGGQSREDSFPGNWESTLVNTAQEDGRMMREQREQQALLQQQQQQQQMYQLQQQQQHSQPQHYAPQAQPFTYGNAQYGNGVGFDRLGNMGWSPHLGGQQVYATTPSPHSHASPHANTHTNQARAVDQSHTLFGLSNMPSSGSVSAPTPSGYSNGSTSTPSYTNGTPLDMGAGSDGYGGVGQTPFSTAGLTPGSGASVGADWGAGVGSGMGMGTGQTSSGDWQTGQYGDQDGLIADLVREISRQSSRAPSPLPMPDGPNFDPLQSFTPDPTYTDRSRSSSPYPAVASFSTTGYRPTSAHGHGHGSPFNKPQSPPALVIPSAPSPALPHIVTQPAAQPAAAGGQGHALANQTGGMGGLLPPTNPQLEHLSGMMGISPIAPNVDGPQIFVQPSTPISGLKGGRGHFDEVLRKAGLAQQVKQEGAGATTGSAAGQGQGDYSAASPNHVGQHGSPHQSPAPTSQHAIDFAAQMGMQASGTWGELGSLGAGFAPAQGSRPRARSESHMQSVDQERNALLAYMVQTQQQDVAPDAVALTPDWRDNVGAWLSAMSMNSPDPAQAQAQLQLQAQMQLQMQAQMPTTVDPNQFPGNDAHAELVRQHAEQQRQLAQAQAQQRLKLSLDTSSGQGGAGAAFKYEPGEFSPTSLAFYQQHGLFPPRGSGVAAAAAASAPYHQTHFLNPTGGAAPGGGYPYANSHQTPLPHPHTAVPGQSFLAPMTAAPDMSRRRSYAEGSAYAHPAAGAGTPGYGVEFSAPSPFGTLDPSRLRGVGGAGHRRAAKSEDLGRGTGWGVGAGGSTTDFLHSITANDGSLIPPLRGRSHSRQSSASSVRSASPALSISSQGSSLSHHRMEMPEGVVLPGSGDARLAKMKVTSTATEVAATSRRTNDGVFHCPVPGCGSTFTRHFNLKGHLRSHNDERPYKCLYDGCPKAEIGFARQHDCKRHMLLHKGLRPFECDGCGKKFARLDALTRHHKSEQGQECAESHPLPVNPDGSAMSESQYKAYKAAQELLMPLPLDEEAGAGGGLGGAGQGRKKGRRKSNASAVSSGGEDADWAGSGMEEYDRA